MLSSYIWHLSHLRIPHWSFTCFSTNVPLLFQHQTKNPTMHLDIVSPSSPPTFNYSSVLSRLLCHGLDWFEEYWSAFYRNALELGFVWWFSLLGCIMGLVKCLWSHRIRGCLPWKDSELSSSRMFFSAFLPDRPGSKSQTQVDTIIK